MDVPVAVSLLVLLLGDSRLRHASGQCLRAGASVPIAAATWGQRRLGSASGRRRRRIAAPALSARLAPRDNTAGPEAGASRALHDAPSAAHTGETDPRSGRGRSPGTVRLIIRRPHPGADSANQGRLPLRRQLVLDGSPPLRHGSVRIVRSRPRAAASRVAVGLPVDLCQRTVDGRDEVVDPERLRKEGDPVGQGRGRALGAHDDDGDAVPALR